MYYLINKFMSQYDDKVTFPSHWLFFSVETGIVDTICTLLEKGKSVLSNICSIIEYDGQSNQLYQGTRRQIASNDTHTLNRKKEEILQLLREVRIDFHQFRTYQRLTTFMFLGIMQKQFEDNKEFLQNFGIERELNWEYNDYIKDQFVRSVLLLYTFINHQNTAEKEQEQIYQFYQSLQKLEDPRYTLPPSLYLQQGLNTLQQQIRQIKDSKAQFLDQLKGIIDQVQIDNNRQNNQIKKMQIFLPFVLLALPVIAWSLIYFPHYAYLSKHEGAWQGSACCLFYYWTNYFLANYCISKNINLIFGISCKSIQQVIFFNNPHYLTALFLLTITYMALLITYLNYWTQWFIHLAINGIFILYFYAELAYGASKISIFKILMSKTSYLHFATMFIPIRDVIASVLNSLSSDMVALQQKSLKGAYLLIVLLISGVQARRKYKISKPFTQMIVLILIVASILTPALFFKNLVLEILAYFAKAVFGITLVLCRYELFSSQSFKRGLKDLFRSYCYKSREDIVLTINAHASYPNIIKIGLVLLTIAYFLLLCFIVQIQQLKYTHKYILQTILMACYILYNIFYINQIGIHIRHPFSNSTHLSQGTAIAKNPRSIIYNLNNSRRVDNPFNFSILADKIKIVQKLQEKEAAIKEKQKQLLEWEQELSYQGIYNRLSFTQF